MIRKNDLKMTVKNTTMGSGLALLHFGFRASTTKLPELNELGELLKELDIDAWWVLRENLAASVSDAEVAPAGRVEQTCLQEVCPSPAHPIVESRLPSARQQFPPFFIGEVKLLCKSGNGVPEGMVLAVPCASKQRKHDRLVVGDGHGRGYWSWVWPWKGTW